MCCLDKCKTILRLLPFKILSTIIIFSTAACNPQTINNITQHHANNPNTSEKNTRGGGGGTGDGGGGQGILCGNDVSDPKLSGKLLVRDIYEAIYNHGRVMHFDLPKKGSKQVDEDSIKSLVMAIKSYFGPASAHLDFAQEKYWQDFANNISFTPTGSHLIPSSDANSPLAVPNGCEIVQIAYWDESAGPIENGTLYVDQKYWEQLDQFNKIALLTHEYFFKQARKAGYKNSDFIRYKVGQLFSKEGLEPLFKDWTPSKDPRVKDILPEARDGFKYCEGTTAEDPDAYLQLYQYQGKNEEQHIAIPVLKSTHINHPLLQSIRVAYAPDRNTELNAVTDSFILAFDPLHYDNFYFENHEQEILWQNIRFGVSNLLFSKHNGSRASMSVTNMLRNFIPEMQASHPEVFSHIIKSNNGPIQFSILNTFKDEQTNFVTLKSAQELLSTINQELERTLLDDWLLSDKIAVLEAISILHNEIDNAITTGESLRVFAKWTVSLSEIVKAQGSSLHKKKNKDFILQQLPELLYKFKLQVHTNTGFPIGNSYYDELKAAGINIYNENRSDSEKEFYRFNQGTVEISQGKNKLQFKLKCKDYLLVFREATNKSKSGNNQKAVKRNMNISYQYDNSLPPPNFFSSTKENRKSETFHQHRLINFHYFRSFMDYLTSGKINSFKDLISLADKGCVNRVLGHGMLQKNCFDIQQFYNALTETTKTSALDCYAYGIAFGPNEEYQSSQFKNLDLTNRYCMVINFEEAKERYMVIFSKPPFDMTENMKNEKYYLPPGINLVLRVP